jgi:hypothetical protein
MTKYKIFFYVGDELTLKTRVTKGAAWIDEQGLHITSVNGGLTLNGNEISSVELFRLHGSMRVIRIEHTSGRLFVSVVRLMVGQFAFVNFFKTGALRDGVLQLSGQRTATH